MILEKTQAKKLLTTSLSGKWALVTGASRGIGQQIALGLAKLHCNVVIQARTENNLAKSIALLKNHPVEVLAVAGELSSPKEITKILQKIADQKITIDILYNNAAIMDQYKPVLTKTPEEWAAVLQVNLHAVIQLCTALVPAMQEQHWGRIINLSSGIQNTPHLAPYSVSKAAIDKYSRDLAWELNGTNVLVNYLDPGWLKTDLGGAQAPNEVSSVLPGALLPALLEDNSISGELFRAQDYVGIVF